MSILLYISIVLLACAALYYLGLLNGALYIPTDPKTVERMLAAAALKPGDRLVDIGSGDGRLIIAAAKQGIDAKGYEINPFLVWLTHRKIHKAKLEEFASVEWRDFWRADLSKYTVVTIFGIAHIMTRLEKKLGAELQPGTRVVCNLFDLPHWKGEKKEGVFIYIKSER